MSKPKNFGHWAPARKSRRLLWALVFNLLFGVSNGLPQSPTSSHSLTLSRGARTSAGLTGHSGYRGTAYTGAYRWLNSPLPSVTAYAEATAQTGQRHPSAATRADFLNKRRAFLQRAQPNGPSGTGLSQLRARPAVIRFGNVAVGEQSTLPLVLFGAGTANVTISRVIVTGSAFGISDLRLPLTLAPGRNDALTVTFAPSSAGAAVGSITIISNAVDSPSTATLSGAGRHEVDLVWSASSSVTTGCNVYRGSKPSGPYTKLNSSLVTSSTYTDTAVQAGQIYYYVTATVDAQGLESAYSNEAKATVPADR